MDHVGAVPYLIDRLGFPVIYTTRFSKAIIQKGKMNSAICQR